MTVYERTVAKIMQQLPKPLLQEVSDFMTSLGVMNHCRKTLDIAESGLLALGLVLLMEFTVVLWLQGLTLKEYFAHRDPVAAAVYVGSLAVFAMMPLLVAR